MQGGWLLLLCGSNELLSRAAALHGRIHSWQLVGNRLQLVGNRLANAAKTWKLQLGLIMLQLLHQQLVFPCSRAQQPA
jgi:hypothetical protein